MTSEKQSLTFTTCVLSDKKALSQANKSPQISVSGLIIPIPINSRLTRSSFVQYFTHFFFGIPHETRWSSYKNCRSDVFSIIFSSRSVKSLLTLLLKQNKFLSRDYWLACCHNDVYMWSHVHCLCGYSQSQSQSQRRRLTCAQKLTYS